MSARGLAARIRAEIEILDSELQRAGAALNRLAQSGAIHELDVAALRLQLWYTGLETLLIAILQLVDGDIPSGSAWHRELCEQAQRSTANRDPILPEEIRPTLNDARSFRHRVRTAYGVEFDPDLLKGVYRRIAEAAPIINRALLTCADDLDRLAE